MVSSAFRVASPLRRQLGCRPLTSAPWQFLKGVSHPGRHPCPALDTVQGRGQPGPGRLSEFPGLRSWLLCCSLPQGGSASHTWLPEPSSTVRKVSPPAASPCAFASSLTPDPLHTRTHMHTQAHVHTHRRTHMHTQAHVYTRAHAHTSTHAHPHTCTHAHRCTHMHAQAHVHTHTHMHMCKCIEPHIRTHTQRTHAHTPAHTHAHTRTEPTCAAHSLTPGVCPEGYEYLQPIKTRRRSGEGPEPTDTRRGWTSDVTCPFIWGPRP